MPTPGAALAPPATLSLTYRSRFGSVETHDVEIRYSPALRLLRIRVDGRTLYRHCGLLPLRLPRARDFKTPGREVHTFLVEPPGVARNRHTDPDSYWVWLDGQPILRVERR